MNDAALAQHNKAKLDEMDPEFARRIEKVLAFMKTKGYKCRIITGWRSPREQAQKVAAGLSKAKYSFHNVVWEATGKPRSFAADIVDDANPYKEPRMYYQQLYRAALDQQLQTGIVYGLDSYRDLVPHRIGQGRSLRLHG